MYLFLVVLFLIINSAYSQTYWDVFYSTQDDSLYRCTANVNFQQCLYPGDDGLYGYLIEQTGSTIDSISVSYFPTSQNYIASYTVNKPYNPNPTNFPLIYSWNFTLTKDYQLSFTITMANSVYTLCNDKDGCCKGNPCTTTAGSTIAIDDKNSILTYTNVLDEQGNLVDQSPSTPSEQNLGTMAPPGYGEHLLDQLYEDVDMSGFQTPGIQSGFSSPFYAQSRSGSSDNLAAALTHSRPVAPAALSSRLADVSLDPSQRNTSYTSIGSASGFTSPTSAPHAAAPRSEPHSGVLTRSNSAGDDSSRNSAEHVDLDPSEFYELNKVPSYQTAVRTPARSRAASGNVPLPDYQTALSAPRTPPAADIVTDPLGTISEDQAGEDHLHQVHHVSRPTSLMAGHSYTDDSANHRRMPVVQGRDQVV